MDIKLATKVIQEYDKHPHVRGTVDCNLLFLKIFEPEKHERFVGRYSTIVGGVRVSRKEFGYPSILEYLKDNDNYEVVNPNFQTQFDIIVFHNRHDVFISLGSKWFGVNSNDHFGVVNKANYDENDYTVFRSL